MAKAAKKLTREPSTRITDFFQRVPSSPAKPSPSASARKAGKPSARPARKEPSSQATSSGSSSGLSAAKTLLTDHDQATESDLSSLPPSSPPMPSKLGTPMSPAKPAAKRKAKFALDDDDEFGPTAPTIFVPKSESCPSTPKRIRFSSPDDDVVPDSQSPEPMELTMPPPRPTTPPPRFQQHTPPPAFHTPMAETPRSKKTREMVENIKRNAAIKAREMSSPESTPPPVFNGALASDSSDEDDADVLGPQISLKGKGKAKQVEVETPSNRYSLRNRTCSTDESQPRTRKAPARGPVILTKNKPPPPKKAPNPLDGLLREKRLAESRNHGEDARRQADNAVAKKHMFEEMENYDSDDDAPTRVTSDPFGLQTPPGDDEMDAAERERILGGKRSKAVDRILEGDKETQQVAQRYEQTLGIALWEDEEDGMDTDLAAPTCSLSGPMFNAFCSAIARRDFDSPALMLKCGMLLDQKLWHESDFLSYVCSLALSAPDRLPASALSALTNLWKLPEEGIPGLTADAAISTLYQMGAKESILEPLGWEPSSQQARSINCRPEFANNLIQLTFESANSKRTSVDDIPDCLLVLSVLALDTNCTQERTRKIIAAIDALCHCIPLDGFGEMRVICNKLLNYLKTLKPIDLAHLIGVFGSGSGPTQRIARVTAHSFLTCRDEVSPNTGALPSLVDLIEVFTGAHEKATFFKVDEDTDYVAMGFYVDIAAIALSDIDGYVREERIMGMGPKESASPRKAGDKPETPLEVVRAGLEHLHSRIVDTRAAHLDRSRTKGAIKNLSMRIHYQHLTAARSGNRQGAGQKNLAQFFPTRSN